MTLPVFGLMTGVRRSSRALSPNAKKTRVRLLPQSMRVASYSSLKKLLLFGVLALFFPVVQAGKPPVLCDKSCGYPVDSRLLQRGCMTCSTCILMELRHEHQRWDVVTEISMLPGQCVPKVQPNAPSHPQPSYTPIGDTRNQMCPCKCGRKVKPDKKTKAREGWFLACCSKCEKGLGHTPACDIRNGQCVPTVQPNGPSHPQPSYTPIGDTRNQTCPCKCGRKLKPDKKTKDRKGWVLACCSKCVKGLGHTPACDIRNHMCPCGCGRKVKPDKKTKDRQDWFLACCSQCVKGLGHTPNCDARNPVCKCGRKLKNPGDYGKFPKPGKGWTSCCKHCANNLSYHTTNCDDQNRRTQ